MSKINSFHYIYLTTNNITKQQYVGDRTSYVNPEKDNRYLGSGVEIKKALNEYRRINFSKIILEQFKTRQEAGEKQGYYIRLYKTHISQGGYNIQWDGGNCYGERTHSKETKEKITKFLTGRKQSNETKQKRSESLKGHVESEETRKKIGLKNKGKKRSKETIKKLSDSHKGKTPWMKGKHHTEKSKEKSRQSHIGKKDTDETKKRKKIAFSGEKNPMFGKRGTNHPCFGSKRKRITCEYCNQIIASNLYARFHGDKCKHKNKFK
jgi:NUMOD3 motif